MHTSLLYFGHYVQLQHMYLISGQTPAEAGGLKQRWPSSGCDRRLAAVGRPSREEYRLATLQISGAQLGQIRVAPQVDSPALRFRASQP
jgi:hypothetical protein